MSATAKICVRCGSDCSNRPRVKDAQGRYCCQDCLKKSHRPPAHPAHDPPAGPDPVENLNPIPLADDEPAAPKYKACMGCHKPAAQDAVICTQCGYNFVTGAVPSGLPEPGAGEYKPTRVCHKCGYDLAGLKQPRCPECGEVVLPKSGLRRDREIAAQQYKMEFIKPAIIFGVCSAIIVAVILLGSGGGAEILAGFIAVAVRAAVGFVVYFVCQLVWLGFDAELKLTFVRLLGVYAAVSLAAMLSGYVPMSIVRFGVPFFVQIWLMYDLMDLDYQDAAIVAVISNVLAALAIIGIMSVM